MPRRKAAAAVEPEVEEIEELDELEELEDPEEEVEEAPKSKGKKAAPAKATPPAKKAAPAAEKSEYDSAWLAEYVTEETGQEYDARGIRMLLRKLAKDGLLEREVGTDRSRYVFPKGPNDPTVKQVVKLVKSGADKAIKNESLNDIKAKKAAERETAEAPAKKTTTKAAAPAKTRRTAK